MIRKRGRRPKHWAETARLSAWYREVKKWSEWSDYKLDMEFAWTEQAIQSGLRKSADRPRTFEWIRKEARAPRGKDTRWRGIRDLVRAVDSHPWLRGTQALYEAEIWNFLQVDTIPLNIVQSKIENLLFQNGLKRVPVEQAFENYGPLLSEYGLPSLFDHALRISLKKMDRYSELALIWLLYIQTEPVHNAAIRAKIEIIADNLLDLFFKDYAPNHHLDYYGESISSLLRTRLDLSANNIGGYGFVEVLGTWLVVPKEGLKP